MIFDYDSHGGILNLEYCYFRRPEEKRIEYSIYEKYGIDPLEELWFWEETLEAIKSSKQALPRSSARPKANQRFLNRLEKYKKLLIFNRKPRVFWYAVRDSNPRPSGP